ncbi:trans-sulfuration enzyme family protein [Arenibaculum pallidiluteum]|uniref:trans-sulfuration enzyme family protein n=1 Tax=Arenibaculum pallidiluteum TaxID=2812559 RepID=UPI001A96C228|nr:aminotransferase class I/II-fold pyridoxal phosphate-dependent enzyme [Arenibaculum pallidiluteum]
MAADERDPSPETLAAQALGSVDGATGAVVPPIHPSTTFLRDADNSYATHGRVYSRADNPTYDQVEALLNRLEGGQGALVFASGMAAATAPVMALRPGDHVVASSVMYWAFRNWLQDYATGWGIEVDFVATEDPVALAGALRPGQTRLVWIETPANPLWTVTDIRGAAELAHGAGALLAVDSTAASPVLTRPIELGADLVMHSGTKYLNGHSDVVAGVLVTARDDAYWQRINAVRKNLGAVLGPFEAWLLLRGLRTLFPRVRTQCANALDIARALDGHRGVREVLYPGLAGHPQHALAARQMQGGFGGMLSVRVEGGMAAAVRVAAKTRLFHRATSLGGVESLIEHRASIEGPGSPVPDDLLRLSVGIEAVEDLIDDLVRALDLAHR